MRKAVFILCLSLLPVSVLAQQAPSRLVYQKSDQQMIDLGHEHLENLEADYAHLQKTMNAKEKAALRNALYNMEKMQAEKMGTVNEFNEKFESADKADLEELFMNSFNYGVYSPISEPEEVPNEQ